MTICRSCGEYLSQHKDGRCDPEAARRYYNDLRAHFHRTGGNYSGKHRASFATGLHDDRVALLGDGGLT